MQLKGLQGGTVTNVRAVLLEGLWVQHTPWEKGYGGGATEEEKGGRGERGKAQTGKREWTEGQTRKREGRGKG